MEQSHIGTLSSDSGRCGSSHSTTSTDHDTTLGIVIVAFIVPWGMIQLMPWWQQAWDRLAILDLTGMNGLTDDMCHPLLVACPLLHQLSLKNGWWLTYGCLRVLCHSTYSPCIDVRGHYFGLQIDGRKWYPTCRLWPNGMPVGWVGLGWKDDLLEQLMTLSSNGSAVPASAVVARNGHHHCIHILGCIKSWIFFNHNIGHASHFYHINGPWFARTLTTCGKNPLFIMEDNSLLCLQCFVCEVPAFLTWLQKEL